MASKTENPYGNLTDRQFQIKRYLEAHEYIEPTPTVEEVLELKTEAFKISDRFGSMCNTYISNPDFYARFMKAETGFGPSAGRASTDEARKERR